MAGPRFLQAVLETREAILLLFRSTKLLAKVGSGETTSYV